MADDYEILDPNKAEPKFDSDSVPVTPILSSKQLSVIDQAIADKKNGEQRRKVILRKKDAEKMDNEYRSGSKLLDVKQGQGESDQFIIVYEYESTASSIRRAFLISTAIGFLICILHSLLGIIYLGYNKELNFNFG